MLNDNWKPSSFVIYLVKFYCENIIMINVDACCKYYWTHLCLFITKELIQRRISVRVGATIPRRSTLKVLKQPIDAINTKYAKTNQANPFINFSPDLWGWLELPMSVCYLYYCVQRGVHGNVPLVFWPEV